MASTNYIVKLFGDPTPFYYYIVEICGSLGFTGVVESTVVLQVGDVLTFGVGELQVCGKIIAETTETIVDIQIINYYDTCEQCVACNGIYYLIKSCSEGFDYVIQSYTLYQPGDNIQIGYECYNVVTSIPFPETTLLATIYSAPLCDICTLNKTIWVGTSCYGGTPPIFISVDNTATSGDVVSVGVSNLIFDCIVLTESIAPGDLIVSGSTFIDSKVKTNCESCSMSFWNLVVRFSPCSDPLTIYEGLFPLYSIGQFESGNFIFSFGGTECYEALGPNFETCPYLNYPKYVPAYYYSSCELCYEPLSAGTEYKMCVLDCSGNTISVSVPHPTWTNNQGKAVVLLDAVQLGGNGLYS